MHREEPAAGEGLKAIAGWRVGCVAVVAIAVLARIVFGRIPLDATDVTFTLIWGRELADGQLPDYAAYGAITPHPLFNAFGAVASVFGPDGAFAVMRGLAYLSFGALVWGAFLLGQAAFSTAAGALAAIALATNPVILGTPLSGTVDTPCIALVLFAAVAIVREPRRGTAALVLLLVAGLLRPEVWLLAGVYWLYLVPGLTWSARVWMGALAVAAPVIWVASDWIVTGEPLFSMTQTQAVTMEAGRVTGSDEAPRKFIDGLRNLLRPPELVGGFIGAALVLLLRRRGASLVPLALLVLPSLGFVVLGALEVTSLIERYLLIPAVALTVTFGLAVFAWQLLEGGAERRMLLTGGVVLLVASLAFVPSQIRDLRDLDRQVASQAAVREDLRDLVRGDDAARLVDRCPALHAAGLKLVPLVGYYLERSTNTIRSTDVRLPADGLIVVPNSEAAGAGFVEAEDLPQLLTHVRGGFTNAAANRSWSLYTRGCRPSATTSSVR